MDHSGHNMDHSGHNMHEHHMKDSKMDMPGMPDMTGMTGMTGATMDMGGMDGMEGMATYFNTDLNFHVLFSFWFVDESWKLALSFFGIFIMAFLYEGLKYAREFLFRKAIGSSQYTSSEKSKVAIADGPTPVRYMEQIIMPPAVNMISGPHFLQTFLHMLQFFISYCLMLIFMTYNVYLCLAVLLGSGCGYFFFGWRKSVVVDITEHCH